MSKSKHYTKQNKKKFKWKKQNFFEFIRALEEVEPKYFLFENVASMNEESKHEISNCLNCNPIFIDSGDFSAQERPRYYWTNIPVGMNYAKSNLVLKDIMQEPNEINAKYYYRHNLTYVDMSKQVCAIMDYKNNDMHKRIFNPNFKCHTLTACRGGHTQKKYWIILFQEN